MTQKTKARPSEKSSAPVIIFGVDDHGKPKAARFPENHADLAVKAAGQLNLQVLTVAGPAITELAARLPTGRLFSNGRGFVPYIRRDLYDKLIAAADLAQPTAGPSPTPVQTPTKSDQGAKATGATGAPLNWDDIGPGHLVLVQESLEEGWYDGIVVERVGDILTVRWPDYPRERRSTVHRCKVGLLYPDIQPLPGGPGPAASHGPKTATVRPRNQTTGQAPAGSQLLPPTWKEIDVNHLVLARDDGPWKSWWEAIPVERTGDKFTLRWRDHPKLPPIVRDRLNLALICPNPNKG